MRKVFIIFSFFIGSVISFAAGIQFQAEVPTAAIVGKPFNLTYNLNVSGARDIRLPDIPNFDVLAGPMVSSSTISINGNVVVSTSFTYTLLPKKEGAFTIPAASIVYDKQKYSSTTAKIKVLPVDKNTQATSKQKNNTQNMDEVLSSDNIFVRAIPSKTRLYEQDYILLTYKLYTTLNLIDYNVVKPNFDGFLKQDIVRPTNVQFDFENYNGRNYGTLILYQTLLYPQKAGTLQIDKTTVETLISVRVQSQIQNIFGGFLQELRNVNKKLTVSPLKIQVDKLPANKPASFKGAVGSLSFKSSISSTTVSANDAITLKYTISGNGNLKLIKNPTVEFPTDFEVYDPKVTNNFKNSTSGVKGIKTVEYLIIPRSEGDFKIPAYTFCYFDLNSKSYKEIKSTEYKIHVKKGIGGSGGTAINFANQEQLKLLGQDIRYIITDEPTILKKNNYFFGSVAYWLSIILPFILSIVLFIVYRKQLQQNSNVMLVKNKRANKVAIKRLRLANTFLLTNQKDAFYDELLKALWGYLSDKLNIPVASLSKENVEIELTNRMISEDDIREFMDVLSVCEFERYSPVHDSEAMDELYNRTVHVITKFQHTIK